MTPLGFQDIEVEKENQVKSYKYGKMLVPVSKDDADELKYKTESGISALGFCSSKSIPRSFPFPCFFFKSVFELYSFF
jgi:hypothetical protein